MRGVRGVRGVRFMMLPGGVLPWGAHESTAARIAPMGWHTVDVYGF